MINDQDLKSLAMAVITQALEDLQNPQRHTKNRHEADFALQDAKTFCLSVPAHEDLVFWANLAEVEIPKIYTAAKKINDGLIDITALKRTIRTYVAPEPKDESDDDLDS